jgi:transposase
MASDLEDLKRRLVVGRKRGGRCIYDEAAKSELVEMCRQPGASVSRLARECGINANQVSRWLREHAHKHKRSLLARCTPETSPFVAVPVLPPAVTLAARDASETVSMSLQARLPNGVTVELRGADLRQVGEVIQAFGRLACSVSTKS